MGKYVWVKVTDCTGEIHEFEDCDMLAFLGEIHISFVAPLGVIHKTFIKRNLISVEYLSRIDQLEG